MANFQNLRSESLLLIVDAQPKFLSAMWEADRAQRAIRLLTEAAALLKIPILMTEQNPHRMGPSDPELAGFATQIQPKMAFSVWQDPALREYLSNQSRKTVVLVGLETHICVALSARDLISAGYEVIVCPDAVTAGSQDRHKLGMELIRDSGGLPAHTETVLYAWLQTAEDPDFRTALGLVKANRA